MVCKNLKAIGPLSTAGAGVETVDDRGEETCADPSKAVGLVVLIAIFDILILLETRLSLPAPRLIIEVRFAPVAFGRMSKCVVFAVGVGVDRLVGIGLVVGIALIVGGGDSKGGKGKLAGGRAG